MDCFRRCACASLLLLSSPAALAQPTECAGLLPSGYGCEFRAVTLPNLILNQATYPFVVEIHNPQNTAVNVTVSGGGLGAPSVTPVAANATLALQLPWVPDLSQGSGTVKAAGASYRIVSTRPVVAMQWNSRDPGSTGSPSGSNDASLLRPLQTADTVFRVLAWPTAVLGQTYPAHVAIVATQDGTQVALAAPAVLQPGAGLSSTGGTVPIAAGDVLLVSTANSDMSGTLITSNLPVLAFAGHALAQVPAGQAFADHLEESLPGVSAFGTEHLVARPGAPAGPTARHFVTIVAHTDATLTFDPPLAGFPVSMPAGAAFTGEALSDTRLVSSAPVLVASFMEGSEVFGSSDGDPSQTFVVPTSQWQRRFEFLAPAIHAPAAALVVAPIGASVIVDGIPVQGFTPVGSAGHAVARVALSPSADSHLATGSHPFTLSVYSYPNDLRTSYWYPAGFTISPTIFADGFEGP